MATTWDDLPRVKKGTIGEQLVNDYLIEQGFIPYSPDAPGAHPFDKLVASRDKKVIFIADAKTKPARKYYPDTGINLSHYGEYKFIQDKYNMDVFLFFVDEERQEIYGNWLKILTKPTTIKHKGTELEYPLTHKGIVYFPLASMKPIAKISDYDAKALLALSAKKEAYK